MVSGTSWQPGVLDLIERLADNKLFLGRRYAEWCTGAPALESAVAAAAMAQDEIGHARSLYPLAQDLAGKSTETVPETRSRFKHVPILSCSFESWPDFIAANLVVDTALTVLVEAATESSLQALAQRARRIIPEESLHWLHGRGWALQLATMGPQVKDALATSIALAWPECLHLFDIATDELVRDMVLDAPAASLVVRYNERLAPVFHQAELSLP